MKKKLLASVVAIPLFLLGWTIANAQEEEDKTRYVVPADTFTCNYNEGKGPADLKKAIDGWNAWMDEQGIADYGAITLTPYYFGADSFDVGWLGFWRSQEAMGAGIDNYLTSGVKAAKGFNDALTCDTHSNWATVQIKPAPEGRPDKFVLLFSDCTRNDDTTYDDLFERLDKAVAYMNEHEYGNGMWMYWHVLGGGGEEDYDFKTVTSYNSYTDFGKAYQHRANGGGRQALSEIMGDAMDCDSSRVYNARTVRAIEWEEE